VIQFHRVAKILEERDILRGLHAVEDAIDDLDAAGRADPARRAFAVPPPITSTISPSVSPNPVS